MIKVYIFNKSNNVSRFDIFKSSLSVSTPKYLWRAALKQMQSIKMCIALRRWAILTLSEYWSAPLMSKM